VKKLAAGLRHNGSHPFVPARSWGAGHGAVPPARPPPPPRTNATAAAAGGGFQLPPTTRPMSRLPAHESQESGPGGGGGGWVDMRGIPRWECLMVLSVPCGAGSCPRPFLEVVDHLAADGRKALVHCVAGANRGRPPGRAEGDRGRSRGRGSRDPVLESDRQRENHGPSHPPQHHPDTQTLTLTRPQRWFPGAWVEDSATDFPRHHTRLVATFHRSRTDLWLPGCSYLTRKRDWLVWSFRVTSILLFMLDA